MNDELDDAKSFEDKISPKDLLYFAKSILLILAFLFLMGIVSDLFKPEVHIFDGCKTVLIPIATLVIGYYFGKS